MAHVISDLQLDHRPPPKPRHRPSIYFLEDPMFLPFGLNDFFWELFFFLGAGGGELLT